MGQIHRTCFADLLNVLIVLFALLVILVPAPVAGAASYVGTFPLIQAPVSASDSIADHGMLVNPDDANVSFLEGNPTPTPTPLPPDKRPAPRFKVLTASDCDPTAAITDTNVSELDLDVSKDNELVAHGGKLKLKVPNHAFGHKIKIRQTNGGLNPGYQPVTNIFTLDAFETDCKLIPHARFDKPLTLEWQYDPATLGGLDEASLDLAYWNEDLTAWVPLYGVLDPDKHTITGQTTHFSTFGAISLKDINPYLPKMEEWQVSPFTGAAVANYPLDVPPGKGGLAPKLNLSYASTAMDSFDSSSQASYVGAGWSLDVPYITRVPHSGKVGNQDATADYFNLVMEGTSYELVAAGGGIYHTSNETFWKIQRGSGTVWNTLGSANPQTWTVTTRDGRIYQFGEIIQNEQWDSNSPYSALWVRRSPGTANPGWPERYIWALKTITDVHQHVINYTYIKDTNTVDDVASTPCENTLGYSYDVAMYPQYIDYNYDDRGQALTRLEFIYSDRTDKPAMFSSSNCGRGPYQQHKLDNIQVKTAVDGTRTRTLVKTWQFVQDYTSVLPYVVYTDTQHTGALALNHVQQVAPSGAKWPFLSSVDYDGMRATVIRDASQGRVQFNYTDVDAPNTASALMYEMDFYALDCTGDPTRCSHWDQKSPNALAAVVADPSHSQTCSDAELQLASNDAQDSWIGVQVYPFQPDAVYSLYIELQGKGGSAQVGIYQGGYAAEQTLGTFQGLSCTKQTLSQSFRLAGSAQELQIRVHTSSGASNSVAVRQVVLRKNAVNPHPVSARNLYDGVEPTAALSYNYTYAGAAVNDQMHSEIVGTRGCVYEQGNCSDLRVAPQTEFRGFATVTEDQADSGKRTEYTFLQGDATKGQTSRVRLLDHISGDRQLVTTDNTVTVSNTVPLNSSRGDQCNFVYVARQTVSTFDSTGVNYQQQVTKYAYTNGKLTKQTEQGDLASSYYRRTILTYTTQLLDNFMVDELSSKTVDTPADGMVSRTTYTYDPNTADLLTTTSYTDSTHSVTDRFTYDGDGNPLTHTDALTNITRTGYDSLYNLYPAIVTDTLGFTTTTAYNYSFGLPATVTDANQAVTQIDYDPFGRKQAIWNDVDYRAGISPTVQITYKLLKTLTTDTGPVSVTVKTRTDAGGAAAPQWATTYWFFDGLGRQIQTQTRSDTGIILTSTDYNGFGQVYRVSNPYAGTGQLGVYAAPTWSQMGKTIYSYDALGREIARTNPSGTVDTSYNIWKTTITDENGHQRKTIADALGRTQQVVEFNSGTRYTTTYTYDGLNRLIKVKDSQGITTTMTYDWLGHKLTMHDPDMGDWQYGYDAVGNLQQQTDAKLQTTCFYYDAGYRLKGKSYTCNPNAFDITYRYDEGSGQKGRRTSMSDASGATAWSYDPLGRLMSENKTVGTSAFLTGWSYDDLNRVQTMTYPNGEVITPSYNLQGLPQALLSSTGNNYVTGAGYNAAGQMTTLTLFNNDSTTYTYDPKNLRLTALQTTGTGGTLQNLSYRYDNVGNVLTITDTVASPVEVSTFSYDDLNRLLSASIPNVYSQAWTYSPNGNIQQFTDNGTPKTYTYDPNHKHAATQVGMNTYGYDPNGNMTAHITDTLTYNAENRLIGVSMGNGLTVTTFLYDGDGQRVSKTVTASGTSTTTTYVGNYYEVTNGAATSYYYFGSQRVAMRDGRGITYFHADHLGSTSVTTGAVSSTQKYFPFGGVRATSGTMPTDYGYTGQRADSSLGGLMDYGARFYDPAIGRFVQADTIVPQAGNPQSLNRYAYVNNNPLKYRDPSGHDLVIVGGAGEDDLWQNPEPVKGWIMGYTHWSDDQWDWFIKQWRQEANRKALMKVTRVFIFNWYRLPSRRIIWQNPSKDYNGESAEDLIAQDIKDFDMRDITLLGHSKGASIVQNFPWSNSFNSLDPKHRPKNIIAVEKPVGIGNAIFGLGLHHTGEAKSGINSVLIWDRDDPGMDSTLKGGTVIEDRVDEGGEAPHHGWKVNVADHVMHNILQVQYDQGGGGYYPSWY